MCVENLSQTVVMMLSWNTEKPVQYPFFSHI